MSTWEQRMTARAAARELRPAGPVLPPDGPPPDDCGECYEWQRYPRGQEHFGWHWVRTCGPGCQHAHHEGDVWLAG